MTANNPPDQVNIDRSKVAMYVSLVLCIVIILAWINSFAVSHRVMESSGGNYSISWFPGGLDFRMHSGGPFNFATEQTYGFGLLGFAVGKDVYAAGWTWFLSIPFWPFVILFAILPMKWFWRKYKSKAKGAPVE